VLISSLQPHAREGIVPTAIREMARELREYERGRLGDVEATVDRAVAQLTRSLGRHPTARETAAFAHLEVEDVVEAWMR
jgi:DNA-directed RNA polymerase specialized sigma subunit